MKNKIIFLSLVLVVIIIGLLHFLSLCELFFYHDTYRRLSYFPIVIGAIFFGIRGGLTLAILTSIAFIPHLIIYINYEPGSYLSELTEVMLYLAAGTLIGIISGRETSLREKYKLLSEQLSNSYDRLHKQTELLIDAEEMLGSSQKLSALGQLSASLAHEIKNPLSSIRGTAEILLDEIPEDHPKREFVDILFSEISRLNEAVENVLQFSRGEQKKQRKINTELLSDIISRVVSLINSHLNDKLIQLNVSGISEAQKLHVDSDKISQVFLNILLNATEAVSKYGKINVIVEKEIEGISVSISDNGPGIRIEDRVRIFEPFFSRKDGGTGLGLSISKKIIESYAGKLSVSEADNGGACFTIKFPDNSNNDSLNYLYQKEQRVENIDE